MSSDNESDLDNAIEGILEDLDSGGLKQGTTKTATLTHKEPYEGTKGKDAIPASNVIDSSNSRRNKNSTETLAKSVRFQDEGEMQSDSVFSKLTPSNLLNSFFMSDDKNQKSTSEEVKESKNTLKTSKPPASDNSRTGSSSNKLTNEEWLGIGKNKQEESSQSTQRMDMFMTNNYDFGLTFDNEEPTSKEDTGKTTKSISSSSSNKPPIPPSQAVKQSETMFQQKRSQQGSLLDAVFETRSVNVNNTPTSISTNAPKQIPYTVHQSQFRPDDSPPSSLDKPKAVASSLIDALPFLLGKQQPKQPNNRGESLSPDVGEFREFGGNSAHRSSQSSNILQTDGGGTTKTVKKKIPAGGKGSTSVGQGGVTLQLPSHLVNEDELKAMSSSLKTLYTNQLQLLEQSYREQLDFFASQSKRKEELLKDDLIHMQEDYDQRINKLKAEADNSQFPQLNQEITHMSSNLEKVSSQLESIRTLSLESSKTSADNPTTEELVKIVQQEMTKEIQVPVLKALSLFETSLTAKLDNVWKDDSKIGIVQNVVSQMMSKLEEISNNHQRSSEHVLNGQTQLRTILVDSVVGSISKAMEHTRTEEMRKKGKSNLQLKELRKDLRRMVSQLDGKNDLIHRSHLNVELEQRAITQSVRDINTFLKVISESGSLLRNDSSNSTKAASVQATMQNEMEIKLLGEERKALSESIAQVNVERRKLTEEKMSLEREKIEFEREKGRIREVEVMSNSRLAEAENLKREAEQLRHQEAQLMAETQSKRNSLSKQKTKLKEQLFELEQALGLKEQKLFLEKSEIIREKEFLEGMRNQSLCSGCLRGMRFEGISEPPPSSQSVHFHSLYPQGTRSSGDGGSVLDYGPATKIAQILTPNEKAYYLHENKYLEELMKRGQISNNNIS